MTGPTTTGSAATAPDRQVYTGTPVVPGTVYAPVVRPGPRPGPGPQFDPEMPESDRAAEQERFIAAADVVADRLSARAAAAGGVAAEVLAADAAMARDRGWRREVSKRIGTGSAATTAVDAATGVFEAMFTKVGGMMAERITDLRDVRDRVVAQLRGEPEPGVPVPDVPSVLCADDLAPADTAGLDPALVVGLATSLGGPTSHTAIIARQLGIPSVVAVSGLDDLPAGTMVLLDAAAGRIETDPVPEVAAAAAAQWRRAAAGAAAWSGPGRTADGHRVEVLANVADGSAAVAAAATPAAGVGLFRTELCFLGRTTEPSVAEQAEVYAAVFEPFADRKVVVRTLDAGSDKPLAFTGHTAEANPALGVRGLRIAFDDNGILDRQLDAIALAAGRTGSRPWVMAPMIATPAEAAWFAERVRVRDLVPGVMIEVPAAALLADRILAHVDFVSLGTNDLAQYTMAADRLSADLAPLNDPWQPAVLALVAATARAGAAAGKPVGVCGEAAADPLLACVLAGLGVTSLSCAAGAVGAVGAGLARVSFEQCAAAAEVALAAADPAQGRAAAMALLG
ncbi:putative PEP-binding protein [Skermania piniformis]|uniref:Phosphoenolpyruvate-protein phosphotransferase n=1 Tax=Skermania pinensis TaxID=39122 RepID=A0ABX8S5Y4_9ACTN|nr:putative PEP-binding protein [Skermania piniformis]QXQ12422.1 phosphoenolpyruvate--protein phosphotransferase [Skermania piniformis]